MCETHALTDERKKVSDTYVDETLLGSEKGSSLDTNARDASVLERGARSGTSDSVG